jgi:Ca2+-transporting ATPase
MKNTDWCTLPPPEVLSRVSSSASGLSSNEASSRLKSGGYNELEVKAATSPLKIFLSQFGNVMVIILIIATIISALLEEYIDAFVIFIIVILNSVFGFVQEYKAEKALKALQAMAAPQATVIREGRETLIPARELVVGDIVALHTGDMVPADMRLIEGYNLKINESTLTGESGAVRKNASNVLKEGTYLGDKDNMAFSSTVVEYGRGTGVVIATAMKTEIGKIAEMIRSEQLDETPLQVKLQKLGKVLGIAILIICAVVFIVELLVTGYSEIDDILELFMVAVSLAVAAIPEGLPAVVTIALALGLQRMVKKHALVRRLPAVETLGSTTVICTDKTGTLTKGVMNIRLIKTLDKTFEVTGEGYEPKGEFLHEGKPIPPTSNSHLAKILIAGALCNDSKLVCEVKEWKIQGDSTEGAFVVAAMKAFMDPQTLSSKHPRVAENPFDSDRKRMSTIHKTESGGSIVYVKGAIDSVLPFCSQVMHEGRVVPLNDATKTKIIQMNEEMASQAYRVLALAYKESPGNITPEDAECNLVFLGLAGMIDAPRSEAIRAIQSCRKAGIRVVMITGDHKLTAVSIARQMGIATEGSLTLTGVELDKMTDSQLAEVVEKVSVYARVSPEHKMKIVDAWKKRGHIVAMTGDGVNDAPALKRADIGIAMGITGTDVSKEAADMVLTDDNFASIVEAVEEGRGIYDNIRKFVRYMLSTNSGEVLVIFIASLLSFPLPMIAIQILWINLLTDGLPALSLSMEPAESGIMNRKPRNPKESIFAGGMSYHIIWVGALMTIGTLGLFWWGLGWSNGADLVEGDPILTKARTLAFFTIALFQLWHVLAIHVEYDTVISRKFYVNKYLLAAVGISALLQLMVIYIQPLADVFKVAPLALPDLLICILVASTVFFAVEMEKAYRRRKIKAS